MDKNKGVNRTFAKGGDTHMFQQQAAATRRKTGKDDVRGPGKKFGEGGGEDRIFGGYAMPARSGVTASPRCPAPSRTRNYGKPVR